MATVDPGHLERLDPWLFAVECWAPYERSLHCLCIVHCAIGTTHWLQFHPLVMRAFASLSASEQHRRLSQLCNAKHRTEYEMPLASSMVTCQWSLALLQLLCTPQEGVPVAWNPTKNPPFSERHPAGAGHSIPATAATVMQAGQRQSRQTPAPHPPFSCRRMASQRANQFRTAHVPWHQPPLLPLASDLLFDLEAPLSSKFRVPPRAWQAAPMSRYQRPPLGQFCHVRCPLEPR